MSESPSDAAAVARNPRQRASVRRCWLRVSSVGVLLPLVVAALFSLRQPEASTEIAASKLELHARVPLALAQSFVGSLRVITLNGFSTLDLRLGVKESCQLEATQGELQLLSAEDASSREPLGIKSITIGSESDWDLELEAQSRQGESGHAVDALSWDASAKARELLMTLEFSPRAQHKLVLKGVHGACPGLDLSQPELPFSGETLEVRAAPANHVHLYTSYVRQKGDLILPEYCVDSIAGTLASDWAFQWKRWETCRASARQEFAAQFTEPVCALSRTKDDFGKERGGLHLDSIAASEPGELRVKFDWAHEPSWSADLDAHCQFTFRDQIGQLASLFGGKK